MILGVVAISGCIGSDESSNNTISFSRYSFDVPSGVTGGASSGGNNALLSYGDASFDVGTNETYGYSNLNEQINRGENFENRTVNNITYFYNLTNGNAEFNQENLITIKVYFEKDNVQYYIIVHTKEGNDIFEIDNVIKSIIKTIHPV